MQIGKGAHASFVLWSNNAAFGNKVFTDEKKCEEERSKFMELIACGVPLLPPIVLPWPAKKSIAMMRMDMTLERAIRDRILTDRILQKIIYEVTRMLMDLSIRRRKLMMDMHLGNILLKFASDKHAGMPRVYLNDPGFMHDFSKPDVLPSHVRNCKFDPRYDLAFFSYSVIGYMRMLRYATLPITPLSERELIPYQKYIGPPHHWDMAVGQYKYQPNATLSNEYIAKNSKRRKVL